MTSLADRILQLVQLPPEERHEKEIFFILNWMKKYGKLMKNVPDDVVSHVVKECVYEHRNPNEIIIRQGEVGDSFYIVLKGEVSIHMENELIADEDHEEKKDIKEAKSPKPKQKTTLEPVPSQITTSSRKSTKIDLKKKEDEDRELEKEKEENSKRNNDVILHRESLGKLVGTGSSGYAFGELALIMDDIHRNASVIADQETHLLVINKDLYNRHLRKVHEEDFHARRKFVDNCPYFKEWSERYRRLVQMALQRERFAFGMNCVTQGDPVRGIHFIVQGTARLLLDSRKHDQQFSQHKPFVTEPEDLTLIEFPELKKPESNLAPSEEEAMEAIKVEHVHVKRAYGYLAAEQLAHSRSIELCSVTNGDLIGDVEVFLGLGTYMQTARCTAAIESYFLDVASFDNLFRRHGGSMDLMKMTLSLKLKSRSESKQGREVPLLKHLRFCLRDSLKPRQRRLPAMKTQKSLPDSEEEWQHLIHMYMRNRQPLILPSLKGAVFLKDLMENKWEKRMQEAKMNSSAAATEAGDTPAVIRKRQVDPLPLMNPEQLGKKPRSVRDLKTFAERLAQELEMEHERMEGGHLERRQRRNLMDELRGVKTRNKEPLMPEAAKHAKIRNQVREKMEKKAAMMPPTLPPVVEEAPPVRQPSFITELPSRQAMFSRQGTKKELSTDRGNQQQPQAPALSEEEKAAAVMKAKKKFVNALIKKKFLMATDNPEYLDWETSDETLQYLEGRLKGYLNRLEDYLGQEHKVFHLPELKRYRLKWTGESVFMKKEEAFSFPKPGGRVMVKRRPCRASYGQYRLADHHCTNYHMVDSIPEVERYKRIQTVLNFFMMRSLERKTREGAIVSEPPAEKLPVWMRNK